MQERTWVVVPSSLKNDLFDLIQQQKELSIVLDKQFTITAELVSDIIERDEIEEQLVCGVIVEGDDAVQVGLDLVSTDGSLFESKDITSTAFFHASLNAIDAFKETDWFQNLVINDFVTETDQKTTDKSGESSSNSSSSMPSKSGKKTQPTGKKSQVGKTIGSAPKKSVRSTTVVPTNTTIDSPKRVTVSTPRINQSKIPNVKTKVSNTPSIIPSSTKKVSTTMNGRTTTTRHTSAVTNIPGTKLKNPNSVTPPIRKADGNTGATAGRRASVLSGHAGIPKRLTSTTKGGVTKSTPPVSAITGRTRKYSRLSEKRPVVKADNTAPATTDNKPGLVLRRSTDKIKAESVSVHKAESMISVEEPIRQDTVDEPEELGNQSEELTVNSAGESTIAEVEEVAIAEVEEVAIDEVEEVDKLEEVAVDEVKELAIHTTIEKQEEENDECENVEEEKREELITQKPVSHHSTSSSTATDEHDDEVAATTSSAIKYKASSFMERISPSGRKSFSPNSVASLPRPETPEVDQLRLRFENISQTPDVKTPITRSTKIPPEFYTRIKDMKPRGPVGTRVKSMVELFMDENLNKWEF